MPIVLHSDEASALHRAIDDRLENFERRRQHRHELLILTCYVDFDAVREILSMTAKKVKLSDVNLMFDYSAIYHHRTPTEADNELRGLVRSCRQQGIKFSWTALKAGALMHAKL